MTSHDVVIIGGGPAGATCADSLLKAGLDAVLLDSSPFPREKPCAGWIPPRLLDLLRIEADEYARERTLEPIRNFRTGMMYGEMIHTSYEGNVSYAVRRKEFDHYLVMKSGVEILPPERVVSIERRNDTWLINGHIRARLLVGAGGHRCPVARILGGAAGGEALIVASVTEFRIDADDVCRIPVLPDTPSLYFCPDLDGYGWMVRKGEYLNIGLGRLGGKDFRMHLRRFCDFLLGKGEVPSGVEMRFKGHVYLVAEGRISRKVAGEGAILIGDSAGLADPRTGEGILPAVRSALLAAEVIAAAGGDYSSANLIPYANQLQSSIPPLDPVSRLIPPSLKKLAGRGILSSSFFTRHYLLDRWFLHIPAA